MTLALFLRQRDKGKQPMVQPKKPKKGPSRKDRNMSTFIEERSINRKQASQRVKKRICVCILDIKYDIYVCI